MVIFNLKMSRGDNTGLELFQTPRQNHIIIAAYYNGETRDE